MSDSGKSIGDCPHGAAPAGCLPCLHARTTALEAMVADRNKLLCQMQAALGLRITDGTDADAVAACRKLRDRLDRLLAVIREVHGQHADDLCFMDIDRIFAAAGLPVPDRRVGDKAAMLANCKRYIDVMCQEGGWRSYAELEADLAQSRETNTRLNRRCQEAEAALRERGEVDLSKFVSGSFGRALLSWGWSREKEKVAALEAEVERLRSNAAGTLRNFGCGVGPDPVFALSVMAYHWVAEIERLKRGEFTPEEFQALCHHRDEKPGCTRADFEAGCREYQAKLFGEKPSC